MMNWLLDWEACGYNFASFGHPVPWQARLARIVLRPIIWLRLY
jgi:hypothetical protein